MFSYLVGERRLAQVELAEQEQVDMLATAHAPIGQSVIGGEITNINIYPPLIVSSRWVREALSDLITRKTNFGNFPKDGSLRGNNLLKKKF